jgi:hypothetical protein
MNSRETATLREAARVLRQPGCVGKVLRCLQCCALTPSELQRVLRGQYRPRTIYGALETLRLVGLARPTGRKVNVLGGTSEIWRVI